MIYHIYGRDITSGLLEIDHKMSIFMSRVLSENR